MTELRLPYVFTADADLTTEWYLEKLIWISERFRENRKVDPGWSTVSDLKSVKQLRVLLDVNKFGRFFEFGLQAKEPYLLSLNDFLPITSTLQIDRKVADTNDLTVLRLALDNLARSLSVVWGEPVNK